MICFARRQFVRGLLGVAATSICSGRIQAAPAVQEGPFRVVLDPGHGGHDPGAVGLSGIHEKAITLAAALELQSVLEATGKYEVYLTRCSDLFLPLQERARQAEALGTIMFVSIHADALADHSIRGASVYTSAAEASDAQSFELARRENAASSGNFSDMEGLPAEVTEILQSLMARETQSLSRTLQRQMVESLHGRVPLLHNPAREADFAVLRSSAVPSVLVEMGFLSNRQDEKLLATKEYRRDVITGLRDAIDQCISCRLLQGGASPT